MVLFVAAALLLSSPTPGLEWSAPPDCPTAAEVARDAEDLSGTRVAQARSLQIVGAVQAVGASRWQLTLRITTATGSRTRTLEADSCQELAEVAATLIAVALEEPEPEPKPEPEAEAEPEPEPLPEPDPAPEPPQDPALRWRAVLGAEASLGLGALPGPAGVLSLSAGAERAWVRAEVEADVWLPREGVLSGDAGGSMQLWTLGVRGCGVPSAAPIRFPICAGLEAGQMAGEGRGVDNPRRAALPWVAVELGAGLRADVHTHIALRVDARAAVPLLRPGFTLDGQGTVHRAAVVAGTFGAGLEVRIP